MDRAGKTAAEFTVDGKDAAAGQQSALIRIDTVDDWGVQFGQTFEAGSPGQTYTFAVLAKSTKGPVTVRLEVERRGKPWDRAGASPPLTVTSEGWKEFHVTFQVDKPFPEGWFAYVSCSQAQAEFRLDALRFYQGEYVPYEQAEEQQVAAVAVHLFDTAVSSPAPLAGAALAQRTGWLQLPEDETDHKFRGDAALVNDRLAVVLRRGAGGAEVYSPDAQGWTLRAVLAPDGDAPDSALTSVTIVDNTPSEASVDAAFASPGGNACSLRFSLAMGQMFVKTEPQANVAGLSVAAPCRFAVLPDFFADDIVIDAAELPVAAAELPSENFLLHLLPGRDAVVMTVASQRDRDARITLSGEGAQRQIDKSVMYYGAKGKIWVAVLGGRDVWHQRDVRGEEAGQIVPLDWTAPFPAQWRVDWRLADRLTASWEMVSEQGNGEFIKHGWFGNPETLPATRHRWTTVLRPVRVPVLARSRRTRVLAAAEEAGAVRRAGRDLSDQPGPDHAAGPVHRGGRGARHTGRRPLRVHPGRGRPGRDDEGPRHVRHARCAQGDLRRRTAEAAAGRDREDPGRGGAVRHAHPQPHRPVRRLRARDAGLPGPAEARPAGTGRIPGGHGVGDEGHRRGLRETQGEHPRRRST